MIATKCMAQLIKDKNESWIICWRENVSNHDLDVANYTDGKCSICGFKSERVDYPGWNDLDHRAFEIWKLRILQNQIFPRWRLFVKFVVYPVPGLDQTNASLLEEAANV